MNFNPGQLPTYESLFPVLINQTTCSFKFPLLTISAAILHLTKTRTGLSLENMSALIAKLKREAKQSVNRMAMTKV